MVWTTPTRGGAQEVAVLDHEKFGLSSLPQDHIDKKKAVEEREIELEVVVPTGVVDLCLKHAEVDQQFLDFLSGLDETRSTLPC